MIMIPEKQIHEGTVDVTAEGFQITQHPKSVRKEHRDGFSAGINRNLDPNQPKEIRHIWIEVVNFCNYKSQMSIF